MPLQPVIGGLPSKCRDKGRDQIDPLDQRIGMLATTGIGLGARIIDDHRDAHRFFVQQFLLAKIMIAQIVAVIAGEYDHRILEQVAFFQKHP